MLKNLSIALFLGFGACTQTTSLYSDFDLWNSDVVTANDGIYVMMPYAQSLLRIQDDGSWSEVDLQGATPSTMIASPDGNSVLVFADWKECPDEDPEIIYQSELLLGQELHF